SIIRNFLTGQYGNAVRVVAFNAAEGWSRDVSEDIAGELLERAFDGDDSLTDDTKRFIKRHMNPGEKRPPAPSVRRQLGEQRQLEQIPVRFGHICFEFRLCQGRWWPCRWWPWRPRPLWPPWWRGWLVLLSPV